MCERGSPLGCQGGAIKCVKKSPVFVTIPLLPSYHGSKRVVASIMSRNVIFVSSKSCIDDQRCCDTWRQKFEWRDLHSRIQGSVVFFVPIHKWKLVMHSCFVWEIRPLVVK